MFKEYDVVILKRALPEFSLSKGARGTVLIVHQDNPSAYVVEFVNDVGTTLGVHTVPEPDLALDVDTAK